jgi:hypothetical protein
VRLVVWTGVSAAAVVMFALAYRGSGTGVSGSTRAQAAPDLIFGVRGSGRDALAPGGKKTACTEMAVDARSGAWRCLSWTLDANDVPVHVPGRYRGPCAHLLADQTRGAWTCLSSVPLPPEALPPS